MPDTDVLTIRISPDEDRRLEEVCPDYLKGGRNSERRARWAINEWLKVLVAESCEKTPAAASGPLDVTG